MSILDATPSLNLSSDFYFPNIRLDIISKEEEGSCCKCKRIIMNDMEEVKEMINASQKIPPSS